jgi:Flp pilus assembly pilin Flp
MTSEQPGKKFVTKRKGAVLAEHGLLLGMLAIVVLTAILLFRAAIVDMFRAAAVTLSQVMDAPGNRGHGNQGNGQGNLGGNPGNSDQGNSGNSQGNGQGRGGNPH